MGDAHYFSPSTRSTADPPPSISTKPYTEHPFAFIFLHFTSLIHNKDSLRRKGQPCSLCITTFHFSDEAANLFDKPEALAISQTPAGVNDEQAVREVSASRATRPPLSLDRGLSA